MRLSEKIKRLRTERGWTQDELGEKAQVHGRHVSRYENGHFRPSDATLKRLAEVFGVPVEALENDDAPLPAARTPAVLDQELSSRLEDIARLPPEEKKALLVVIDALVTRNRISAAIQPGR